MLIGRWENQTSDGVFSETWIKENDSLFLAESYFINEKDTLFSETIRLEAQANDLFLIVTVPNQNEEKPVAFKLTSSSSGYFVFENPEHDFPKKITYRLINQDSLFAEISGNGKNQGFPFSRFKLDN